LLRASIIASFFVFATSACDSHDEGEEAFDTFDDCYVDHHDVEAFDVIDSIKICCLDHPIGGTDPNIVCGETQADCEDFVDAEVLDPDATVDEIATACEEYLVDREL
jgi:hypothetical protein